MTGLSWSCPVCTYFHQSHGTRCSMCGSLRTTKSEMIDFIQGKTLNSKAQESNDFSQNTPSLIGRDENKVSHLTNHPQIEECPNDKQRRYKTSNPYLSKTKNPLLLTQKIIQLNNGRPISNTTAMGPLVEQNPGELQPNRKLSDYTEMNDLIDINHPKPLCDLILTANDTSSNLQHTNPLVTSSHSTTHNISSSTKVPEHGSIQSLIESSVQTSFNPYRKTSLPNIPAVEATNSITSSIPPPISQARMHHSIKQPHAQQTVIGPVDTPFTRAATHKTSATTTSTPGHSITSYQPGPVPLHPQNAATWIFPQSDLYRERKYQLDICQTALLQNTLVSLPTGLGKTLIAAVVMYNFYRWFPQGKVVFLAPTRPLVTQQIDACYKVMKIPESDTAEITGRQKSRENLWSTRRVFFCTPQTFQKDIEEGRCEAVKIVCICFDEAHKATGKYAYAQVIERVEASGAKFRVLGLSATPGKDIKSINAVLQTLKISKIEARLETDQDVKEYVHERVHEIIKCDVPDSITRLDGYFTQLVGPLIERIQRRHFFSLLQCNSSNLTSYQLLLSRKECHDKYGDHTLDSLFVSVQSLLTVRERLVASGIGVARNELKKFKANIGNGAVARQILQSSTFHAIVDIIIGNEEHSIQSATVEMNNPKLLKLKEVLSDHFSQCPVGESSRAIVFSQWRDSVEEIVHMLNAMHNLVKAAKFVGQSSGSVTVSSDGEEDVSVGKRSERKVKVTGMNQAEQQAALSSFRKGLFNVLVCTCIGEEGLDICEVDLIVNFDCLRSPIRMVQRVGRTGRNRDGRVICLVTKGPEERRLEKSEEDKRRLWNALKRQGVFKFSSSPDLVPARPMLERKVMNSSSKSCRLSQIGGYVQHVPTRKRIGSSLSRVVEDDSWILNSIQERYRSESFGDVRILDKVKRRKLYVRFWQEEAVYRKCEDQKEAGGNMSACLSRLRKRIHGERTDVLYNSSNRKGFLRNSASDIFETFSKRSVEPIHEHSYSQVDDEIEHSHLVKKVNQSSHDSSFVANDKLIDAMIDSVNICLSTQSSSDDSMMNASTMSENRQDDASENRHDDAHVTPMHPKPRASRKNNIDQRVICSQFPTPFLLKRGVSSQSRFANEQFLVDTPDDEFREVDQSVDNMNPIPGLGKEGRKKDQEGMKFLDLEAMVESDYMGSEDEADDDDDRYDSEDSFINDSSQLGYTQDGLIDESTILKHRISAEEVHIHRQVDHGRAIQEQYATPVLTRSKRQILQKKKYLKQDVLTADTRDQAGNSTTTMPFIRTVLEHHRNGGTADEFERRFLKLHPNTGETSGFD